MSRGLQTIAHSVADAPTLAAAARGDEAAARRLFDSAQSATVGRTRDVELAATAYAADSRPLAWAGRPSNCLGTAWKVTKRGSSRRERSASGWSTSSRSMMRPATASAPLPRNRRFVLRRRVRLTALTSSSFPGKSSPSRSNLPSRTSAPRPTPIASM